MKQQRLIKPIAGRNTKQRGDVMLDAMIAMLLAMVIGLGPVYVASRAALAKRQAAYKNLAVVEMRKLLSAQGPSLCGTTPQITVVTKVTATTVLSLPVAVTCTTRAASGITIGGQAVDPTGSGSAKTVSLSVTSSDNDNALFGGSGTITIVQNGTS